jgi:hypothetical protein
LTNALNYLQKAKDLIQKSLLHPELKLKIQREAVRHEDPNQNNLNSAQKIGSQADVLNTNGISEGEILYRLEAINLTINYNNNIVLDKLGTISEAINGYNELIKFNPLYYEALLRLRGLYHRLGGERKSSQASVNRNCNLLQIPHIG